MPEFSESASYSRRRIFEVEALELMPGDVVFLEVGMQIVVSQVFFYSLKQNK